jgi:adenylate cyclase
LRSNREREHMNRFLGDLTRWCLGLAAVTALALCLELPSAAAQAPTSARPKLAVLPLENNSGDATQNFFAEGMTDEIASALTGVRGVDVVARSSSFQLKPGDRDIKAIGQSLNASYLVQGSARMMAGRVHLNVRVVQASDGAQLWSEELDAALPGIFDLEENIAKKIAAALNVSANPGEVLVRSRTGNTDAYLDFLRAKVAERGRLPMRQCSWSRC